jgi:acetylornithine deacetylase/succinyl-diaminopimelate desuccinylase-like protein
MGHLDVVSADPADWTHPPFAADVADGFLWGRGATDMKQMIAVSALILLELARRKQPLQRDVLFLATADEEHGGRMGMGWLARERPELFDVAAAINEGGGSALRVNGREFYTCQTAEKGVCRTVWRARGQAGHASQPRADMATLKLAQAVGRLGDGHLRAGVVETMRRALTTIARAKSDEAAVAVEALLTQGQIEAALSAAGFDEEGIQRQRALYYDTSALTVLQAGDVESVNVIPPVASAYVDSRILPGQTDEGLLALLRQRAGDDVEIGLHNGRYSAGLEASPDAPIFRTIAQVIAERCDGAQVIPWQCAGSTDAKSLSPLGVPVFGFVPARPLPEGIKAPGAHATDERLWIENLYFAFDVLYDVVVRFCQT